MMDPSKVMPNGFHLFRWDTEDGVKKLKWHDRSSVCPVAYHYTSFGSSHQYPAWNTGAIAYGSFGRDWALPEMSMEIPYDPFKEDVYQLGHAFKALINVGV